MSELISLTTKVLLSGVLVLLAGVFLWQVWRIWESRTLVLSPFDFLENGKPAVDSGEQFARMIRADLVQLASLYNEGEVTNTGAVPAGDPHERVAPLDLPAIFDTSFFDTIELKAYGIEFGTIFKSLRRQIESPSEISGNVTHQGDKYSVFVELKQSGAGRDASRWDIPYAKDVPEATRSVACRIFRHLAGRANGSTTDAALFRSVSDDDFCLFNQALASYDQYRLRKAVLSDADAAKLLAETDAPLGNLVGRDVVTFPYVHKLAALVFYEKKKYVEAEGEVARYTGWLAKNNRTDASVDDLSKKIQSQKIQTTPAISHLRPLQPGSSVGPLTSSRGAGMICCIVKDANNVRYILGAKQVLGSTPNAKIVQPATEHGGSDGDVVAEVAKSTATVTIARLHEDVVLDARILSLGPITGLDSSPPENRAVVAYGFDGKRKDGKVVSTGSSAKLPIEIETESGVSTVTVENFVIVSGIASANELGAPVVTTDGKLVGMIFATGGPTTFVLPVEPALKELGVELVK
jgi:hypothetical protein